MVAFSPLLDKLIAELSKLPGVGKKTAQRLAFHLLERPEEEALELATAIREARLGTSFCSECCNLSDTDPCPICSDFKRDRKSICVLESARDLNAIERSSAYHGLYHVLHGVISPLKNIGPEEIKLPELIQRLQEQPEVEELILALNPSPEGEATGLYIARLLAPAGLKITRLASGLPAGGELDFVDELTLSQAIEGRREI
ncbi:MAG: recombination mediator RecR [Eubacteriales bacterium]|nr:recombination mediator RecR [Eubacteriales bacterium]